MVAAERSFKEPARSMLHLNALPKRRLVAVIVSSTTTAIASGGGDASMAGKQGVVPVTPSSASGNVGTSSSAASPGEVPPDASTQGVVVQGGRDAARASMPTSTITRADLDERLPRSAPDALRFEPGVFVQQTAHGQGSAYVRGRTGQQTVLLFDGIRLNNAIYRQGPNQYFFTVDARTVESITVVRGGASTLYGSDAIGGVIDARPIEPGPGEQGAPRVRPRAFVTYASADASFGQRMQAEATVTDDVTVLGGVGYRRVGQLRAGANGAVLGPESGEPPLVPRFGADGVTQLGTGFDEVTFDARAAYRVAPGVRLVAAGYGYRQYDAPRTDQCPPPFAPPSECLRFDEQFRTLVYTALEGDLGVAGRSSKIALSYQRAHEKRTRERPTSSIVNVGRDDVDSIGLTAKLSSAPLKLAGRAHARVDWGGDVYVDSVASKGFLSFTDIGYTRQLTRGQYLDGSRFSQGGAFAQGEATLLGGLTARVGGRGGAAVARAAADPESGSRPVTRTYPLHALRAGLAWQVTPWLTWLGDVDRSIRAPNLDDLTSRQQTGPGFQFENPALGPELGTNFETGLKIDAARVSVEAWVYRALLTDAITRLPRAVTDCPPQTLACNASWFRFQLVNAYGLTRLHGAEVYVKARLPGRLTARATVAWAEGDGPTPGAALSRGEREVPTSQPISRVPPLNGTVELRWVPSHGAYVGGALRWAALQDRLSIGDRSDARIPAGGTPGFAVVDARAGYRVGRALVATLVVENLTDAAHRYHGSSVNGPGRGLSLQLESGF